MAIFIEVWKSVTGIWPSDFFLFRTLPDAAFDFYDDAVYPGELCLYMARRHDAATGIYTNFSPYVTARGATPLGDITVTNISVAKNTKWCLGIEGTEGQGVQPALVYGRVSGQLGTTRDEVVSGVLNGITGDADADGGASLVPGSVMIVPTPEALAWLVALYGAPVTTLGGGTAPDNTVGTPTTTGGTLLDSTPYYWVTDYNRSDIDEGYTKASVEQTVTTGAGGTNTNKVSIASPGAQAGATTFNVYVGTILGGAKYRVNAAPVTIGTPYLFTALPTAAQQAVAAIPSSGYNIHTFNDAFSFLPVTVTEVRGLEYIAQPGVIAKSLGIDVDKLQKELVRINLGLESLYENYYTAQTDIGTNALGADTLKGFAAIRTDVQIAGVNTADVRKIGFKIDRVTELVNVFNQFSGGVGHAVTDGHVTGTMELYNSTQKQLKVFMGQLDAVATPYGLASGNSVLTVSILMRLISKINAAGFLNQIKFSCPRVRYSKRDTAVQQGPINQAIDFAALQDPATGTQCQIIVHNSMSNANVIAAGIALTATPINGANPYHA